MPDYGRRMPEFASVILVDPRGWLLLQERDEHPAIDPETWSLVGGHLEPGEDPLAAAYRELEEETGVRLAPGAAGELSHWHTLAVFHAAYASTDPVHVHLAPTVLTDADIECHEGRRIVFVEPRTALTLRLSALAQQALPALLTSPAYATMLTSTPTSTPISTGGPASPGEP